LHPEGGDEQSVSEVLKFMGVVILLVPNNKEFIILPRYLLFFHFLFGSSISW